MNATAPTPGRSTDDPVTTTRLRMKARGWRPVPISSPWMNCSRPGKSPSLEAWSTVCIDASAADIAGWRRPGEDGKKSRLCLSQNTGVLLGKYPGDEFGLVGVDNDILDMALSRQLVESAREILGRSDFARIGQRPKVLFVYRTEAEFTKISTPELFLPDGKKCQVEILGNGQQFVAFGDHPVTGDSYQWHDWNKTPRSAPISSVPLVTDEALRRYVSEAEAIIRAAGGREAEKTTSTASAPRGDEEAPEGFFARVNRAALNTIEPWFTAVFPDGRQERSGAWRVSSAALGRPLEEDISVTASGGRDFGEETGASPIDLVARWHSEAPGWPDLA